MVATTLCRACPSASVPNLSLDLRLVERVELFDLDFVLRHVLPFGNAKCITLMYKHGYLAIHLSLLQKMAEVEGFEPPSLFIIGR